MRIGVHPDDPPVSELGGVPRHMFGTFDGYVKAFEIANSPNVGICLCCGTWMEGGAHTGKNVLDAAREFAKMDKLWKIHFRNVSGPIPDFVETYVDGGYTDMKQLMRTLVDVDVPRDPDRGPRSGDGRGSQDRVGLQPRVHQGAVRDGQGGTRPRVKGRFFDLFAPSRCAQTRLNMGALWFIVQNPEMRE